MTKVPVTCLVCHVAYSMQLNKYNYSRKKGWRLVCSDRCRTAHMVIHTNCSFCAKTIVKRCAEAKKSKSGSVFCSQSCAARHNNAHKTHGTRRSKLEIWLETQLVLLFPILDIHFNKKDAISSELDIFFPKLKLAFELNGIFHYKPIHGHEKLNQIQINDSNKIQACLRQGIELCIVDTSEFKHFKPTKAETFLFIIKNLVNQKLGCAETTVEQVS